MADISVTLTADNLDQVLEEFAEQVEAGLEAIGLQAERHAKENITRNGTVDTGLLRNSVTHAVSGGSPALQQYSADRGDGRGSYSGIVGDASEKAVYIGTNVEYAPYVEYGHKQEVGRYVPAIGKRLVKPHVPAQPYLRPAASQHNEEYKRIMEAALKDEL